jgi:excisionase family DNA binding protein
LIQTEITCRQMKLVALQSALLCRVQAEAHHCLIADGSDGDRMLTVDAAANALGVHRRWIQNRYRQLPFVRRLGRRTIRISESALMRWMERQGRR